jgi:phage terminase small subunit
MAAPKRQKIDSIKGQKLMVQALSTPLVAPMTLANREQFYFDLLTSNREKATWTPDDLANACRYGQEMARIEKLEQLVKDEGLMIKSGTRVIMNPAIASIHQANSQQLSILRYLGLSGTNRGIAGPEQANRNQAEKKLLAQLEGDGFGDLI